MFVVARMAVALFVAVHMVVAFVVVRMVFALPVVVFVVARMVSEWLPAARMDVRWLVAGVLLWVAVVWSIGSMVWWRLARQLVLGSDSKLLEHSISETEMDIKKNGNV